MGHICASTISQADLLRYLRAIIATTSYALLKWFSRESEGCRENEIWGSELLDSVHCQVLGFEAPVMRQR